jgi:WD40 repeat protein
MRILFALGLLGIGSALFAKDGREAVVLSGHGHGVEEVAFSPDGRWLVSGSGDGTVKIWDMETFRESRTIESGHRPGKGRSEQGVTTVAFSPDGKLLASGGYDGKVRLWDGVSWEEVGSFEGGGGAVRSVVFHPKADRTAGNNPIVRNWEGDRLAVGGVGMLKVWSVQDRVVVWEKSDLGGAVLSVAYSSDGMFLASVIKNLSNQDARATIKVWDAEGGELLHTLNHGRSNIWDVAFCERGVIHTGADRKQGLVTALMASAGWDDRLLKLWNARTGELVRTHLGHPFDLSSVAFSRGGYSLRGHYLASADIEPVVQLWDMDTGEGVRTFLGHTDYVTSLAFDPKGRWLASSSRDKTVRLWPLGSVAKEPVHPRKTLKGHANGVMGVAF